MDLLQGFLSTLWTVLYLRSCFFVLSVAHNENADRWYVTSETLTLSSQLINYADHFRNMPYISLAYLYSD